MRGTLVLRKHWYSLIYCYKTSEYQFVEDPTIVLYINPHEETKASFLSLSQSVPEYDSTPARIYISFPCLKSVLSVSLMWN